MRATEKKIGVIILAAGESKRLGSPKQLLKFENHTLIRRAAESAIGSQAEPIVAVLGSNFEAVKSEIKDLNCAIVFNENWQTGMSSSIETGIEKLLEIAPETSAVIISLCDQPFVKSEHFNQLIDKFYRTKKPIVAAFYGEKLGVPALFGKEVFSDLLNLEGDRGARKILNQNAENIEKMYLPEAVFDVDTIEDFEKIKSL